MARIEHVLVIHRPIEVVFAYLDDPDHLPDWQAGVVAAHRDGPPAVGTHETHVRSFLGRRVENRMQITSYEPPHRYGVRGLSGPLPYMFTSTLTPVGDTTEVRVVLDLHPGGVKRVLIPLLRRAMARQLRADFERLQRRMDDQRDELRDSP